MLGKPPWPDLRGGSGQAGPRGPVGKARGWSRAGPRWCTCPPGPALDQPSLGTPAHHRPPLPAPRVLTLTPVRTVSSSGPCERGMDLRMGG